MKATVLACIAGLLLMGNSYAQQDFDINTLAGDYEVTQYYYYVDLNNNGESIGDYKELIEDMGANITIKDSKIFVDIRNGSFPLMFSNLKKEGEIYTFSDISWSDNRVEKLPEYDGLKYPIVECNYFDPSSNQLVICIDFSGKDAFGAQSVRIKFVMIKK